MNVLKIFPKEIWFLICKTLLDDPQNLISTSKFFHNHKKQIIDLVYKGYRKGWENGKYTNYFLAMTKMMFYNLKYVAWYETYNIKKEFEIPFHGDAILNIEIESHIEWGLTGLFTKIKEFEYNIMAYLHPIIDVSGPTKIRILFCVVNDTIRTAIISNKLNPVNPNPVTINLKINIPSENIV